MFGIHDFWLFVASGIVLNVTPGPDTLYIVGRSVAQGRRAGAMSALGISSGCVVHTVAAAVGLSALLAGSAAAFAVVRYAGAVYLIYLGVRLLCGRDDRSRGRPTPSARPAASDGDFATSNLKLPTSNLKSWTVYRQGLLTNVLNPKVALFFLAFLPQFVGPDSPHRTAAFLLLGLVFVFNGTIWCLGLAWFGAAVSRRLRERPASGRWLNCASGAVFIGLGVRVARG
jgi:threonine/homoserine/homoserine lactone efflux protein